VVCALTGNVEMILMQLVLLLFFCFVCVAMSNLVGKRVVIFGGSSGMGKAAAKAIVALGGFVHIVGTQHERRTFPTHFFINADL
jgi:NADPH:quinone reductase-like Zn-dependent oxidoreductase